MKGFEALSAVAFVLVFLPSQGRADIVQDPIVVGVSASEFHGAPHWDIASEPNLVLGDPEPNLIGRVDAVTMLVNGTVVVADGTTHQLLFYDDERLAAKAGGLGDGPGEFRSLGPLVALDDSTVAAFDALSHRLTTFGHDGVLREVRRFDLEGVSVPFVFGVGILDSGSLIISGPPDPSARRRAPQWVPGSLYVLGSSSPRLLATVPAGLVLHNAEGTAVPIAVRPQSFTASDATGVWHGVATEMEFRHFGEDGRIDRIVRLEVPPQILSEAEKEALRRAHRARMAAAGIDIPALVVLDRLPVFRQLLVDSQGLLWLETLPPFAEGSVEEWLQLPPAPRGPWVVIDPRSGSVRRVAMPDGFTPMRIDNAMILGVARDELGVETVQIHDLNRTPG